MGRKTKKGLDYFSLTTSFSDSIKLCAIELGSDGICVMIELWQSIYANNGYYMELTEDHKMLFIKDSMSKIKLDKFNKCLEVFFKRGIFDKQKYDKYQILTSDSIQERYIDACTMTKRTNVLIYSEYLLIEIGANDKIVVELKDKLGVNTDKLGVNTEESAQRKEKKNKEKKNKEEKEIIYSENDLIKFDEARKFYKGTKLGNKTEFDNFIAKNKDWQEILPLLLPAMVRELADKQKKFNANGFKQNWKNLSTWINQRCWETEYPNLSQSEIDNATKESKPIEKKRYKIIAPSFYPLMHLHLMFNFEQNPNDTVASVEERINNGEIEANEKSDMLLFGVQRGAIAIV